jgi:hypothetical protein
MQTTVGLLLFAAIAQAAIPWRPCPDINAAAAIIDGGSEGLATFDCANLTVPLDYTDDASPPLNLSLYRVNATQEPVLGSVIINWGGPVSFSDCVINGFVS